MPLRTFAESPKSTKTILFPPQKSWAIFCFRTVWAVNGLALQRGAVPPRWLLRLVLSHLDVRIDTVITAVVAFSHL